MINKRLIIKLIGTMKDKNEWPDVPSWIMDAVQFSVDNTDVIDLIIDPVDLQKISLIAKSAGTAKLTATLGDITADMNITVSAEHINTATNKLARLIVSADLAEYQHGSLITINTIE